MKTLSLISDGSRWLELRQDGKRFLVKRYTFKKIERMKWFRNLRAAATVFDDELTSFFETFRLEKKGGEK